METANFGLNFEVVLKQGFTVYNGNCYFQNLEGIRSSADEMEMFAAIVRKFKQTFQRQENMKTFKTYDRIEVTLTKRKPVTFQLKTYDSYLYQDPTASQ